MRRSFFLASIAVWSAVFTTLVLVVSHNAFFWDNVWLMSIPAHWYYEYGLTLLVIPEFMDFGHPSLPALYLAVLWSIFGKSLVVSHLGMLHFVLLIVIEAHRLAAYIANTSNLNDPLTPRTAVFAALLAVPYVLLDPVFLTQTTLVAQDIVMIGLYLFCLNRVLFNRRLPLALGLILLVFASTRGMIAGAALWLGEAAWVYWQGRTLPQGKSPQEELPQHPPFKQTLLLAVAYLPAGILAAAWLAEHYARTGWIGVQPNGELWKPVNLLGIAKNVLVVAWRYVDNGRIVVMLVGVYALWKILISKGEVSEKVSESVSPKSKIAIMTTAQALVFLPFFLLTNNPVGHRYLLPVILPLNLLAGWHTLHIPHKILRRTLYATTLVVMLTGHTWAVLYPDNIAKGWDSTLAHLPYYALRKSMMAYIVEQKIPPEHIGTAFPNIESPQFVDASNDGRFKNWHFAALDTTTNRYVFASTVFNDKQLRGLRHWRVVQEYSSLGIRVQLLESPHWQHSPR